MTIIRKIAGSVNCDLTLTEILTIFRNIGGIEAMIGGIEARITVAIKPEWDIRVLLYYLSHQMKDVIIGKLLDGLLCHFFWLI